MRKVILASLAFVFATLQWSTESAACRWCRHARRCPPPPCYAPLIYSQPCYAPMGYVQPAPAAWSTVPSAQAAAAPQPAVKTFTFQGKTYQAIQTNERGESEEPELRGPATFARPRPVSDGEHFAGKARKVAKTSFASGAVESFASPGALITSILNGADPASNDTELRGKLNPNSARSSDEQRNVTVTAFLYATKKEADNDFHLLIGDSPDGGDGRFMTAEVSGLPSPDDRLTPQFQTVRDQYKAFFTATGQNLPSDRYVRFPQPVPVTITGSIFFDVDHTPGEVHTANIIPDTVWEIHPISNLVFGTSGGQ